MGRELRSLVILALQPLKYCLYQLNKSEAIILICFHFTIVKEIYFTSPLKNFSRSFLSSRTNCGKTSLHLESEQRFIVNCFKLSFHFGITSDPKRKGNGIVAHVANNNFCKEELSTDSS